jgi:FKBP-type peptidyl-prolyl cis-trans isomerase (trigger factor)
MPDFQRQPDGSLKLTLIVTWPDVLKEYEHQLQHSIDEAEMPGFRKGKAPRDIVEPKLNKSDLYSHCLEALLPQTYSAAIKAADLKPILYPHIKVIKGEIGQDWLFEATTCEAPIVILGDYVFKLKDIKTDKPEERLSTVLRVLSETSQVTLPQILIDEEVNHRLANLTDNLTKLGMTTENYLNTKKLTAESLKATLITEAGADLTMEFILQEVGRKQNLADRTQVLDYLKTL